MEEPPAQSIIVLLSNSRYNVIETIKNRCQSVVFEKYSFDVLSNFIADSNPQKDIILKYANTPGKISEYLKQDINTFHLCN